jgi:hypothetical protein
MTRYSRVPSARHNLPTLNHPKTVPYIDYPVVGGAIVTNEPFFAEYDFTFVTSDAGNTTLSKWNGTGYTAITGLANPDVIYGRGFYAVTTASAAYVTVTEHVEAE